eukprot:gene12713-15955_t
MNLPGSSECARLDLMDFSSVREFARKQKSELSALEKNSDPKEVLASRGVKLLVNNAGVMGVAMGADGEDHHLRANHLGPFLLTRLMIPAMAPASRIVNVSSRAHFKGSIAFDQDGHIQGTPSWWWPAYARSKLCNVLMTAELRRRLPVLKEDASSKCQPGICVYGVSPGPVATSLFRYFPWWMQWLLQPLLPLFRTPTQGAESSMFAATSQTLEGRSVLFIHDNKHVEASAQGRDTELATKLWAETSRLVGLGSEEDKQQGYF